jgi:hypothetical protein
MDRSVLSAVRLALVVGAVMAAGALVPMLWGHATWPESRHALWVTVPLPVTAVIVVKLVLPWRERRAAEKQAVLTASSGPEGG